MIVSDRTWLLMDSIGAGKLLGPGAARTHASTRTRPTTLSAERGDARAEEALGRTRPSASQRLPRSGQRHADRTPRLRGTRPRPRLRTRHQRRVMADQADWRCGLLRSAMRARRRLGLLTALIEEGGSGLRARGHDRLCSTLRRRPALFRTSRRPRHGSPPTRQRLWNCAAEARARTPAPDRDQNDENTSGKLEEANTISVGTARTGCSAAPELNPDTLLTPPCAAGPIPAPAVL